MQLNSSSFVNSATPFIKPPFLQKLKTLQNGKLLAYDAGSDSCVSSSIDTTNPTFQNMELTGNLSVTGTFNMLSGTQIHVAGGLLTESDVNAERIFATSGSVSGDFDVLNYFTSQYVNTNGANIVTDLHVGGNGRTVGTHSCTKLIVSPSSDFLSRSSSAALEVQAPGKGILFPVSTETEMRAIPIASGLNGMIVDNSGEQKLYRYNEGFGAWVPLDLPPKTTTVTASTYTVLNYDRIVIHNCTNDCTITLPPAYKNPGRIITVKRTITNAKLTSIVCQTGDTFNPPGPLSAFYTENLYPMFTENESYEFVSSGGTLWQMISHKTSTDWQSYGACVITAITTAPTKPTSREDVVLWRRRGKSMEVKQRFMIKSATGFNNGNGQYLIEIPQVGPILPNFGPSGKSIYFSDDVAIYTSVGGNSNTTSWPCYSVSGGVAESLLTKGWSSTSSGTLSYNLQVIPYTSTVFRLAYFDNAGYGLWGSNSYGMQNLWGFTITYEFPVYLWSD